METALTAHVLDRQFLARFQAEDRLVLGAVIHEQTLHFLHLRHGSHVADENDDLDRTFDQRTPQNADLRQVLDALENIGRQRDEQTKRQRKAEDHRNDPVLERHLQTKRRSSKKSGLMFRSLFYC